MIIMCGHEQTNKYNLTAQALEKWPKKSQIGYMAFDHPSSCFIIYSVYKAKLRGFLMYSSNYI